jgi:hypothetical protein
MKKFGVGFLILTGSGIFNYLKASVDEDNRKCLEDLKTLRDILTESKSRSRYSNNDLSNLFVIRYWNNIGEKAKYKIESCQEWLNLSVYEKIITPKPRVNIGEMKNHSLKLAEEAEVKDRHKSYRDVEIYERF